ncbi:MAG: biopolymer transporter ExbD [Pirellulales bacterium]|nr:biopolymer transporter ExbD [Pirellulales bacterium]MBX3434043.1 biopolymer transporter ExbD [Pirellulales bacterium]
MAEVAAKAAPSLVDEDFDDGPLLGGESKLPDAEMDITPMIDVTFLLLIFFIVCSTMDPSSAVDLAAAKHGQAVGERECFIITVVAGGMDQAPVYLADGDVGDPLSEDLDEQNEQIRAAVEEAKNGDGKTKPKQDVLIKADRNVAHRDVARVIKAVSKVSDMRIHLAVAEAR